MLDRCCCLNSEKIIVIFFDGFDIQILVHYLLFHLQCTRCNDDTKMIIN